MNSPKRWLEPSAEDWFIHFFFSLCSIVLLLLFGCFYRTRVRSSGRDGIPVPTRPDPKIENDWVPGNFISFGKQ